MGERERESEKTSGERKFSSGVKLDHDDDALF